MGKDVADLSMAEVWAYARCPYEHFWRYAAGIAPPPTARGLVEQVVCQALRSYYGGGGSTERLDRARRGLAEVGGNVVQCVGQAWRETLGRWGYTNDTWDVLVKFAAARARVMEPFLSGRAVKRDGSRYKVPEMSNEYKRRAMDAGLPHLAARLNERLAGAPVSVAEEYGIPEAFSDSVEIAGRNTWPGVDAVAGVGVPFAVHLTDGLTLGGAADLVTLSGRQAGVEVHDWGAVCPPTAIVRRDLRVVAALHAAAEGWDEVERVVFRHMRTGATVSVQRLPGTGRLLAAAVAAAAGIRCRVYVPRLAAQSRDCLVCEFYGLCTDGQDVLDTLDPTLLAEIGGRAEKE